MLKLALKNLVTKIFVIVFLCSLVLFLSAFMYPKESKYLTRMDLAITIEKILADIPLKNTDENLPNYSDLSKSQNTLIIKTIKYKIMNGYSDNTFRPQTPLHNLEVVSYLQRLTEFLRDSSPNSYSTKQLFRFLSYNEDPSVAFEYNPLNFSKGFSNPNELTPKILATDLLEKLTNYKSQTFIFSGKIIDCINNKPVVNAYISVNNQAMAVDKYGRFRFCLKNNSKIADIFAVADDYQPIELRKDLDLSRDIVIRLKPNQQ